MILFGRRIASTAIALRIHGIGLKGNRLRVRMFPFFFRIKKGTLAISVVYCCKLLGFVLLLLVAAARSRDASKNQLVVENANAVNHSMATNPGGVS